MNRAALLLLSGLVPAQPAQAQPVQAPTTAAAPALDPATQAYVRTDAYRKLLVQAMARIPASIAPHCPKQTVSDGLVVVLQPLQFNADQQPVAGSWRHSRNTAGCGPETIVNFWFYATPERRVLTVVGVPGNTRADIEQQRNARTFVLLALDPVAHGCQGFETVNTRFEAFGTRTPELADPGPGSLFRPWWETWTMLGCGKRYTIPLNFRPNQLGTQIVQPGGITQ